jgi:hypothetical protein
VNELILPQIYPQVVDINVVQPEKEQISGFLVGRINGVAGLVQDAYGAGQGHIGGVPVHHGHKSQIVQAGAGISPPRLIPGAYKAPGIGDQPVPGEALIFRRLGQSGVLGKDLYRREKKKNTDRAKRLSHTSIICKKREKEKGNPYKNHLFLKKNENFVNFF